MILAGGTASAYEDLTKWMLFMLAMGYLIWQIYLTYQQHWHYEQKLQYQLVTGQNA